MDKVASIKDQIAKLRSAVEKQDKDGIKSGTEALEKLMHEVAQEAYAGAGGPPGAGGGPGGPAAGGGGEKKSDKKKQDDVIDAEYEEGSGN